MSHADEVREYCSTHIIAPARLKGAKSVTIRAGEVHRALRFQNRLPLVCSAIGARIFENSLRLKRVSVDGPLNGANTEFTFILL